MGEDTCVRWISPAMMSDLILREQSKDIDAPSFIHSMWVQGEIKPVLWLMQRVYRTCCIRKFCRRLQKDTSDLTLSMVASFCMIKAMSLHIEDTCVRWISPAMMSDLILREQSKDFDAPSFIHSMWFQGEIKPVLWFMQRVHRTCCIRKFCR